MQKQWLLSECISRKGETNILIWFSAEAKRGKLVLIKDLKTVQTEISVDFFLSFNHQMETIEYC
jgi:hypothetical protein